MTTENEVSLNGYSTAVLASVLVAVAATGGRLEIAQNRDGRSLNFRIRYFENGMPRSASITVSDVNYGMGCNVKLLKGDQEQNIAVSNSDLQKGIAEVLGVLNLEQAQSVQVNSGRSGI